MKCQHCGVHFDDDERVCPMCGARAGTKGRMTRPEPKWHGKPRETYTDYHPTIANSSSAKTTKSKARPIKDKPKTKKRPWGLMVAVLVILTILPNLFAFVVDELIPELEDTFTSSYEPDYGDYDTDYDSDYSAADLSAVLGTDSGTVLDNGDTIRLHYEQPSDEWALLYTSAAGGTFKSEVDAWCTYADPDEYYYMDDYPAEQYDMYTILLTPDDAEMTGALPEWCRTVTENDDSIWLLAYVSKTDDELVLEDWDSIGLFDGAATVPFFRVQDM